MTVRAVLLAVCVGLTPFPSTAAPELPENLAASAAIRASSEYNGDYAAKFVADGYVPEEGGQSDVGKAWCIKGQENNTSAELTFEWREHVTVAELVYYARTAWFINECWKDYEVYADASRKPILTGRLEMRHGPQHMRLPEPVEARRVRIVFTSSHGGGNPGASEVQVFASPASEEALKQFMAKQSMRDLPPQVDNPAPAALANLIRELADRHGATYSAAEAHLAQLNDAQTDPAALQREALLFDMDRLVVIKRHEIVASHVYTYHYEGFAPGGGLYVVSAHDPDVEPVELVATPEGQILECDLSYDGTTVLFSWRERESEGYHLWTIGVDGANLTQLTQGEWHDYNACWLPDGGIAFLSTRSPQFAYCWHAPVGVVHRMNADGTNVQRLSANYLNDFTPYVLNDGRLIYSRWEYVDKPAIPIQSLWTLNPDGTGLAGFYGNRVLSPGTFMDARPLPGEGTRILCTMTGHNGPARGAIGLIDRRRGVNAQDAITNVTPDVPIPAVNQGNGNTDGTKLYSCPVPLDETRFLVSARGPVLVRNIAGTCQSIVLPAPKGGMQYFSAQPVRPRHRPPAVPPAPESADTMATVYVQDIYNGLEPWVKRGEVERIRVVREMQKTVRIDPELRAFGFQFPVISCGATYAGKEVLGEVPVEEDGSAYFRVPSGVPLYFMVLDAQGRAVQRMRSFTHFMPGETQGCIGCHESRQHAARPQARAAYRGTPRNLRPPEWGVGGFGYAEIVQPVLDRYCIKCHYPPKPPHGIDLTGDKTDFFNVSYDVLARQNQGPKGSPYVSWIPTYNGQEQNILEVRPRAWGSPKSRLAEVVLSGHKDGDGNPRFNMDEASRRRILAWMDLNVPYYASSETAHPDLEGCRRIYPADLDRTLARVARKRCASCHKKGGLPRAEWTRITRPEYNRFLTAPLAKTAGGTERCGEAIFASKDDPDYQAIRAAFEPVLELLQQTPRMDMANAKPAPDVCRDRK